MSCLTKRNSWRLGRRNSRCFPCSGEEWEGSEQQEQDNPGVKTDRKRKQHPQRPEILRLKLACLIWQFWDPSFPVLILIPSECTLIEFAFQPYPSREEQAVEMACTTVEEALLCCLYQ